MKHFFEQLFQSKKQEPLTPKVWKGVSMHEEEMRTFWYRLKIFFRRIWDKDFREWEKRVKTPDELTPKERQDWYEEEAQMWRNYWEDLL